MQETRKCPYCAEDIPAEAIRCRYCRSRVAALDPARWYRDHPERRLAGVASAIAHALAFPVTGVRLAFVVLTFVHLLGPLVYGALWLVIPREPGTPSALEGALAKAQEWVARLRGDGRAAPPPAATNGSGDHLVSGGPLA
jgi:phage shock protein PspC (stress-responsive transcriptional regulator)